MDEREADALLKQAVAAMHRQRFEQAIEMLDALCHERPTLQAEAMLAECRYRAGADLPADAPSRNPGAVPEADPFAAVAGVPEITADALNTATLAAGIRRHGALLVRGLLSEPHARALARGVETALADCRSSASCGRTSPWYSALALDDGDEQLAAARKFVEDADGVWAADSPRMLLELIDVYRGTGLLEAITGYFGERPLLSVRKTTLRRVPPGIQVADWHQDGAFLGRDIRSVNLWLSLSHCGVEASGLDLLPRRLEHILPTGSHGACFDWAVGQGVVDAQAAGEPIASPRFAPGDALLFDHFLVHRTGIPAGIRHPRYAVESWFFAPSAYPADQVPLQI